MVLNHIVVANLMSKDTIEHRINPDPKRWETLQTASGAIEFQCEFKQGADIWSMSLYPIMDIKLVLRGQTKTFSDFKDLITKVQAMWIYMWTSFWMIILILVPWHSIP